MLRRNSLLLLLGLVGFLGAPFTYAKLTAAQRLMSVHQSSPAAPPLSPPSVVQTRASFAGSTSLSLAYSSNVTAGNALIVCFFVDGNASSYSVTDNNGNVWAEAIVNISPTLGLTSCWYATNANAGATTVTVSEIGGTWDYVSMSILEASNISAVSPLDQTGKGSATGATTSVSMTTTGAVTESTELVVAFAADWQAPVSWTQGAGYTIKETNTDPGDNSNALEVKNTMTGLSGTQTATFTKGAGGGWIGVMATFKGNYHRPAVLGITGGADVSVDDVLVTSSVPTVNWSATVPAPGSYDVIIYQDDGTTVQCAAVNTTTAVTSFALPACTSLVGGNYYKAKVLTRNSGGTLTGDDSPLFRFYYAFGADRTLPVYSTNGVNWNDYLAKSGNSPFGQSDRACILNRADNCFHGGEIRKVVTAKSTCTSLTVSETLGAFDWVCSAASGNAIFYTTGLKSTKGLGDLVQESGWIANPVTISDTGVGFLTTSGNWWSNTVTPLPDNSGTSFTSLAAAGTIYVLDASRATKGYNINANKIAVVIRPSATLRFVGSSNNCNVSTAEVTSPGKRCMIAAGTQSNLWIEGNIEGQTVAIDFGVYLKDVTSSRLNRVNLDKANMDGLVLLADSDGNRVTGVTVKNLGVNYVSLKIEGDYNLVQNYASSGGSGNAFPGWYNRLTNIRVANPRVVAIDFNGSYFNTLHQANISNGGYPAINCYTCWDATVTMVTENHISDYGGGTRGTLFQVVDGDRNTILATSALSNYDHGLTFGYGADNNTVVNHVTASQFADVVNIYASNNTKIANLGAFLSFGNEIYLDTASNNTFSESLFMGGNSGTCSVVNGGTNPGLVDTTCANQGSSTATYVTGLDVTGSFVGKVTSNDTANGSDSSGTATYSATMDWLNFDNWYRSWGLNAANWTTTVGQCNTGTCRIWDWRLKATDTALRNRLGTAFVAGTTCPAAVHGNKTMTDQQASPRTFLLNAFEIVDNYRLNPNGNNNGLCESGEACIYTPNLGAYQGEGDFEAAGTCTFQNGTVSNVQMYAYPTNGI